MPSHSTSSKKAVSGSKYCCTSVNSKRFHTHYPQSQYIPVNDAALVEEPEAETNLSRVEDCQLLTERALALQIEVVSWNENEAVVGKKKKIGN